MNNSTLVPDMSVDSRLREDWPALVMLVMIVVIVTGGIAVAGWVESLESVVAIGLMGLFSGYFLARSSFSALTALIIASVYGMVVIGLQQMLLLDGLPLRERSAEVLRRVATWVSGLVGGGYSQDNIAVVLLLGIVVWFAAYNAAWNIFRARRLWRAALLPGVGLTINNFYYSGPARLDLLLPLYLLAVLALAIQSNTAMRKAIWREREIVTSAGGSAGFLLPGLLASMMLLAVAWLTPVVPGSEQVAEAWVENVAPRLDLQEFFSRTFTTLNDDSRSQEPVEFYASQTLTLGTPLELADASVMQVFAPDGPRYYWRAKVFDTFDGRSWSTSNDAQLTSEFGVLYYEDASYRLRHNVRQRFELRMPASRLIYSASQPVSVGLPVTFDVQFIDRNQERGSPTEVQVEKPLFAGDAYEVISSVSYADEASLRAAGTDYPAWVMRNYLQIPESTSERTVELARQLTAPYDNSFDKVRAVEQWLRENITYDESIAGSAQDGDAVDWVLFEQGAGCCSYYATAMTVMLRTQNIPARVAAGFAQGDYNRDAGSYRVLESDAHTWVEVFFPDYGWIEFEPTAARPEIATRGIPIEGESGVGQAGIGQDHAVTQLEQEQAAPVLENENQKNSGGLFGIGGISGSVAIVAVWALSVLVVSVLIGTMLSGRRALRGLSGVARVYARLNVLVSWLGVRVPSSYTPHERAAVLSSEMPEIADSIGEITALYVQERFSPSGSTNIEEADAKAGDALKEARPVLVRRIVRRRLRFWRRRG